MRAIERTTRLFTATLTDALPAAKISVQRSVNRQGGRSNYVYIDLGQRRTSIKVRISDHPIGMRRALSGAEQLHIPAGASPASWAVWVGQLCRVQA